MSIRVDHVMVVGCFAGGSVESYGPEGFSRGWHDPIEGVDWAIDRLTEGYESGVRRFMFNRPMGRGFVEIPGTGDVFLSKYVPGASWHTLEPERRERLESRLREWTEIHPDAEVGVFVGMRMRRAATSFTAFDHDDWIKKCEAMDPKTAEGLDLMRLTLGGWMSCGVSAFYLDASADPANLQALSNIRDALKPLGARVIGEAVPMVEGDGQAFGLVDPKWARMIGWIAQESFILTRFGDAVAPEGLEVHDWITHTGPNHDLSDDEDRYRRAQARASQGYIIVAGLDTLVALRETSEASSLGDSFDRVD